MSFIQNNKDSYSEEDFEFKLAHAFFELGFNQYQLGKKDSASRYLQNSIDILYQEVYYQNPRFLCNISLIFINFGEFILFF